MEYSFLELLKKILKHKIILVLFLLLGGVFGYFQTTHKAEKTGMYISQFWIQEHNPNKQTGNINDYAAIGPIIRDLVQTNAFAKGVSKASDKLISTQQAGELLNNQLSIEQSAGSSIYTFKMQTQPNINTKKVLQATVDALEVEIAQGYDYTNVKELTPPKYQIAETGKLSTKSRTAVIAVFGALGLAVGIVGALLIEIKGFKR
jgi:hypothetical protein